MARRFYALSTLALFSGMAWFIFSLGIRADTLPSLLTMLGAFSLMIVSKTMIQLGQINRSRRHHRRRQNLG